MKVLKNEIIEGRTVVTAETAHFLFFKRVDSYVCAGYRNWIKLTNDTRVPDKLSSQLDNWKELGEGVEK